MAGGLRIPSPRISKPNLQLRGGPQLGSLLGKRGGKEGVVVGLELEAGSVGATELAVNGEARVTAAAVQPLPPGAFADGEVTDPEAVTTALRALFTANKLSRRVRLGIANQRVVVRTLRLPAIEDPAELDSAVRFSAQEQIAMPLDQAVIDHRVVGGLPASDGAPAQIDVIVVAARRDMITASLRPLKDAGLEPVGIDLSAFGMIRALAGAAGPAEADPDAAPVASAVLYCSVGDVTNLAVAKGRSCLFTRVSPVGLDDVVSGLTGTSGLTPEHAQMWLNHVGLAKPVEQIEGDPAVIAQARAALENGAASLLDELRLSIDFYGAQETAVPIERVVLCGTGSAIPGLAEEMQPDLGLPISVDSPAPLGGYGAESAARLTLPYGLALND
ncbi:MAG TPA: type IV pilus assembly protein PilM [Solirubrobacterales bacterium]|jgi:type IV pilus assembly protein PilM|nr:type IV pilus assembly protein PilM [Solirubrobacterales bacterium]